ncbi:membrane protein insertase YidC [Sinorhizobium meliloti WSM1022]|jgi:YidC/Oxa1 family membrane protein insertase|uniref:Membrane protein insertase YidC n=5 Tax=Rhizobium meliloti TaxID=382 RepID=YIDC_RHIME|nr:membrane protein insertase YidC [Sinorhizobium meliloti]Q92SF5.2 RecName: Full=Membrane protein insertase YidC; AltName: Full=Foldase YidC; AltName: Full=Membrane integrase YidC; AltName: Full=Membrane protein YidC [Sinorhizobium meliloti 1021]TWA99912.1 protein translocase subunit yidC [Ensifer sp. SEMIA 134]TWB34351.1 protein translocase subunit yidC [Ensifer sp. SEMIA 135]AEG03027.1 Membrane protein oxaA [Sinorhizobium meliloti BL225C]AEG51851.1 Membrane protein oxaA [Sinorhizobium melil
MENNRNYFVAIALSVLILIAWQFFYVSPKMEKDRIAAEQAQQAQQTQQQPGAQPAAPGQALPGGAIPSAGESRDQAIGKSARVAIDTPALSGSINLTGARFDDLKLKGYRETVDPKSPVITLFSPAETADGYFTEIGYIGSDATGSVPGPQTTWTLSGGDKLTPSTPVTLSYTNDKGITFARTISVDDRYMFQVVDSIKNETAAPVSLSSYGRVTRFNKPTTPSIYVLHEGFVGVAGEHGLQEVGYSKVEDDEPVEPGKSTGGWLGITDKYWAATIVPPQATPFDIRFSHFADGRPRYQSDYKSDAVTVAPGQSVELKNLVFAGAKEVPVVDNYEVAYSIPNFDKLIDWGWFYFITKPMFKMMDFFFRLFGNFGIAILITTIVVKLIFFPLANKQYASMANMKKVQPKMEELKKKFGDDRMGLQQAMMQLYKEEKINPLAGCWPILIQIPVFFALYKVIYVTIEMRHAPFFGWIQDLSAPDPTTIINLFGLLPFEGPAFLHLGIWPIIMGVTMFLQMRMNPTPPDPTQAMLFTWMPVVFTFMLASFPAGLVIYWAWNNTLSILQQGIIMKRQGVKVELFDNLKSLFSKKPKPAE